LRLSGDGGEAAGVRCSAVFGGLEVLHNGISAFATFVQSAWVRRTALRTMPRLCCAGYVPQITHRLPTKTAFCGFLTDYLRARRTPLHRARF